MLFTVMDPFEWMDKDPMKSSFFGAAIEGFRETFKGKDFVMTK